VVARKLATTPSDAAIVTTRRNIVDLADRCRVHLPPRYASEG